MLTVIFIIIAAILIADRFVKTEFSDFSYIPLISAIELNLVILILILVDIVFSFFAGSTSILNNVFESLIYSGEKFQNYITQSIPYIQNLPRNDQLLFLLRTLPFGFFNDILLKIFASLFIFLLVINNLFEILRLPKLKKLEDKRQDRKTQRKLWYLVHHENDQYGKLYKTGKVFLIYLPLILIFFIALYKFYSFFNYEDQIEFFLGSRLSDPDWSVLESYVVDILLSNKHNVYYLLPLIIYSVPALLVGVLLVRRCPVEDLSEQSDEIESENQLLNYGDIWVFLKKAKKRFASNFIVYEKRLERRNQNLETEEDTESILKVNPDFASFHEQLELLDLKSLEPENIRLLKSLLNSNDGIINTSYQNGSDEVVEYYNLFSVLYHSNCTIHICSSSEQAEEIRDDYHRKYRYMSWYEALNIQVLFSEDDDSKKPFDSPSILIVSVENFHQILLYNERDYSKYIFRHLSALFIHDINTYSSIDLQKIPLLLSRFHLILDKNNFEDENSRKIPVYITQNYLPGNKDLAINIMHTIPGLNKRRNSELINPDQMGNHLANIRYCTYRMYNVHEDGFGFFELFKMAKWNEDGVIKQVSPIFFFGFNDIITESEISGQVDIWERSRRADSIKKRDIVLFQNDKGEAVFRDNYLKSRLVVVNGNISTLIRLPHYLYYCGADQEGYNKAETNLPEKNDFTTVIIIIRNPEEEFFLKYYLKFWGLDNDGEFTSPEKVLYSGSQLIPGVFKGLIEQYALYALREGKYTKSQIMDFFDGIFDNENAWDSFFENRDLETLDNKEDSLKRFYITEDIELKDELDSSVTYGLYEEDNNRLVKTIHKNVLEHSYYPLNKSSLKNSFLFYLNDKRYVLQRIDDEAQKVFLNEEVEKRILHTELSRKIGLADYSLNTTLPGLEVDFVRKGVSFKTLDIQSKEAIQYNIKYSGIEELNYELMEVNNILWSSEYPVKNDKLNTLVIKIKSDKHEDVFSLLADLLRFILNLMNYDELSEFEVYNCKIGGEHYILIFDLYSISPMAVNWAEKVLSTDKNRAVFEMMIEILHDLKCDEGLARTFCDFSLNKNRLKEDDKEYRKEHFESVEEVIKEFFSNYRHLLDFKEFQFDFIEEKEELEQPPTDPEDIHFDLEN